MHNLRFSRQKQSPVEAENLILSVTSKRVSKSVHCTEYYGVLGTMAAVAGRLSSQALQLPQSKRVDRFVSETIAQSLGQVPENLDAATTIESPSSD